MALIYLSKSNKQPVCVKTIHSCVITVIYVTYFNVLLLNAVLSLNNGLPKDLQVGFLHYKFLKLKYKTHRIMYIKSLAVTALPCNSKNYFVTLK